MKAVCPKCEAATECTVTRLLSRCVDCDTVFRDGAQEEASRYWKMLGEALGARVDAD